MGPPPDSNVLLWIVVFGSFGFIGTIIGVLGWFAKRVLSTFDGRLSSLRKEVGSLRQQQKDEIDGVDNDLERLTGNNRQRIDEQRQSVHRDFAKKERVELLHDELREWKDNLHRRLDSIQTAIQNK